MKRCARFLLPGLFGFLFLPSAVWAEPVVVASVQADEAGMYSGVRVPKSGVETASAEGAALQRQVKRSGAKAREDARGDEIPMWRRNFFVRVFEMAGQFDWARLHAALHLVERTHARKMRLLDYKFSDVNGDGALEVSAISEFRDKSGVLRLFSVYEFDSSAHPMLRYEKRQTLDDAGRYSQTLAGLELGIGYCEDWQISSWQIHECHDIVFDRAWQPWVSRHEIRTADSGGASSQRNVFDFRNRRASRSYARLPDGPFMPALSRYAGYDMIFAPHDAELSQASSLRVSQATSSGAHEPVAYAVSWNSKGVYYAFEFRDGDLRTPEACSDQLSVQKVDHAEFWFDLEPSLEINRDAPQSWQLEYEKDYGSEPYRHSLDSSIFGVAVTADGCVVPMSPARNYWPAQPKITASGQPGGYRIEMFMPAEFFGVSDMKQLDRSIGLSFTALQHDVHGDMSWETVSTSDWRWPDPFTFAQIWLLPQARAPIPPFPLQWRSWLVDN